MKYYMSVNGSIIDESESIEDLISMAEVDTGKKWNELQNHGFIIVDKDMNEVQT